MQLRVEFYGPPRDRYFVVLADCDAINFSAAVPSAATVIGGGSK